MENWNYDYSYQMGPFGTILSLGIAVLGIVAM